jgi:very-short-patch-repair endonuclease
MPRPRLETQKNAFRGIIEAMHQTQNQTQFARRLRRKATLAEKVMWILLRDRDLAGYKFRRQHPIGRYTVDFVSIVHRLIVECDGISHVDRSNYDQLRDTVLGQAGYRILHFTDAAVHGNPDQVAAQILAVLRQHNPQTRSPLP